MAMTLRLSDEQDQALTLLADALGVSKQEATVRAITDAAARHVRSEKVAGLSQTGTERYADLLNRLAQ
jgi:predicted transcriptional regulator